MLGRFADIWACSEIKKGTLMLSSSVLRRQKAALWRVLSGGSLWIMAGVMSAQAARADSVRVLPLSSHDLVHSAATNRLYISSGEETSNAVIPIDPVSGTTEAPLTVGPRPKSLAISVDGQTLYAGLGTLNAEGEGEVARINLGGSHVSRFALGKSSSGEGLLARDLAVHPSNADTVAVVRSHQSQYVEDVAIYDGGVRRSRGADYTNRSQVVTFDVAVSAPPKLYGFDSDRSFRAMTVDSSGIASITSVPHMLEYDSAEILPGNAGLIYSTAGRVVNGTNNQLSFTLPRGPVCPDRNGNRVFVLSEPEVYNGPYVLRAYTMGNHLPIGKMNIEGINGTPSHLVRWGSDGLAFRTSGGQVFLVQSTLVTSFAQQPTAFPLPVTLNLNVRVWNYATNDLIYDATRGRVWMSIPSRVGPNGNRIVSFNPYGGSSGSPFSFPQSIGSEPGKLARSDDGQYLYCGLNGSAAVAKFWLSSGQGGTTFSLGNSSSHGPHFAGDIEVLPGQPNSFAVSRYYTGVSPNSAGVVIHDGAQQRVPAVATGGNVIEFGASTSRLYGADIYGSSGGMYKMTVDASGVRTDKWLETLASGNIKYAAGLVYTPYGRIVDAESETVVGQFDTPNGNLQHGQAVIPDVALNRVFFLVKSATTNQATIRVYRMDTREAAGALNVPNVNGSSVSSFIRWGRDGLAFRTDADQVFFVHSPLFVDEVPPIISISTPMNNTYATTMPPSVSGRVSDSASPLGGVDVTIRRASDGHYWNRTGWVAEETRLAAGTDLVGTPHGQQGIWFLNNIFPAGTAAAEGDYVITAYTRDAADNKASAQSTLHIDRTPPSGTVTIPVHASAVRTFTEIRGTATDNMSGVAIVQFGLFRPNNLWWNGSAWVSGVQWLNATADGATWKLAVSLPTGADLADGTYSIVQRVVDKAGNVYHTPSDRATRFALDTTAPVTQLFYMPEVPPSGWYRGQAGIGMRATDNASGIAKIMYSLDNAEPAVFVPNSVLAVTGNAIHQLRFWAVDNAGNEETARTVEIKIDAAAPSGTVTQPQTQTTFQNLTEIRGTATDELSGIRAVQFGILRSDGQWWDGAAWVSTAFWLTAHADDDSWVVNSGLPAGADLPDGIYRIAQRVIDVAGNTYQTPGAELTTVRIDAAPPVTQIDLRQNPAPVNGWYLRPVTVMLLAQPDVDKIFYQVDDGATQTYQQAFVVNGEGKHSLRVWAVDKAGNQEAPQSVEIKIDLTAPALNWGGFTPAPNANGWNNTTVEANYTATDAASGIELLLPAPPLRLSEEGRNQTRTLVAKDVAGRQTSFVTPPVHIDLTAPKTVATLEGTTSSNDIYTGPARVTLTATDNLSGVQSTFYRINGGEIQIYAAPFEVAADGTHTVEFWSVDRAGNIEDKQMLEVAVDTAAPVTTAEIDGPEGHSGWFTGAVTVTLSSDTVGAAIYTKLGDGEARLYQAPLQILNDGRHTLLFWSIDRAGNREAAQTVSLNIDSQAPGLSWGQTAPAPNAAGWNNTPVSIPFTASDVTSGVQSTSTPSPLTLSVQGRDQSQIVTVRDVAGNAAPFQSPRVNIDLTAPNTTASIAATTGNNDWLRSAATITLNRSDALSGVQSTSFRVDNGTTQVYNAPFTVGGNGTHTISFSSVDHAGNAEATVPQTFKIDAQPPTLTLTASPNIVRSSKKKLVVQISGRLSDALSGFDSTGGQYSVVDEYGISQPSGTLSFAADGTYRTALPLQGSSEKRDRDGRIYTITARGRDRAGNSVVATATVVIR
jgi:hypothetical protein